MSITFTTPYEQYHERQGQSCEIVREVPHESFDYDECGPLYVVRFDDGIEIEAWPEEVGKA